MGKPQSHLRILCFGDSLTAGYASYGTVYHPYAREVQRRLAAVLPKPKPVVEDDGVPGETAGHPDFIGRMREQFDGDKWDWTIVLGGTNDLGWGHKPDTIFSALQATWNVALEGGSKVLALTVPECDARSAKLDAERDELNARILSYDKPGFFAFDLNKAIPYHSLTDDERKRYWDDGLHLTPAGYDWMGGHVGDALVEIIRRQDPQ